jgi:hypothetical protein
MVLPMLAEHFCHKFEKILFKFWNADFLLLDQGVAQSVVEALLATFFALISCLAYCLTLKMGVTCSCETLVGYFQWYVQIIVCITVHTDL